MLYVPCYMAIDTDSPSVALQVAMAAAPPPPIGFSDRAGVIAAHGGDGGLIPYYLRPVIVERMLNASDREIAYPILRVANPDKPYERRQSYKFDGEEVN